VRSDEATGPICSKSTDPMPSSSSWRALRLPAAIGALAIAAGTAGLLTGPAAAASARSSASAGLDQAVVWRSGYSGTLDQATTLTGHWRQEPAGYRVTYGAQPSVAIDTTDGAEYVTWRGSGGQLWVAVDQDRAWTQVDTGVLISQGGSAPSIAVDDHGIVTIAWRNYQNQLREATNASGGWSSLDPNVSITDPAAAPDVAVNPVSGRVNIVWADASGGVWRYSSTPGATSGRVSELPAVTSSDQPTSAPAISVTPQGVTVVVWRDFDGRLFQDIGTSGSWNASETAVVVRQQSTGPQLATFGGSAFVVWANAAGSIYKATGTAGTWTVRGLGVNTAGGAPAVVAWTPIHPTALRGHLVDVAESQMGYTDPSGQGFCNKFSYYWRVGYSCQTAGNRSEEWCSDFAKWVWAKGGAEVDGNLTPSAASFRLWAIANHRWHSAKSGYVPKPGDAVVYGLDPAGTWAAHVAIVVGTTNGLPDVVNGDFNYGVSGVVPKEVNEYVTSKSDIGGYASPMPAGSRAASVRNTTELKMGLPTGWFGAP
jgi:hypothetical protein